MRIIRLHLEPEKPPTHIYCLLWFPYGIWYASSSGAVFFPACCFYNFSLKWNTDFFAPFYFFPRLPSLLVSSFHITLEILPFYTLTMSSLIPETDWVASVWKHLRKTSSTVEFLLLLYRVGWSHLLSAVSHILVWFIMHRWRLGL